MTIIAIEFKLMKNKLPYFFGEKMKFLSFLVTLSLSFGSQAAQTKKFCGVREGTAGNAFLVNKKGNTVITFSRQGGDQSLLEQTDNLIGPDKSGETGTQNGTKYCVIAEIDKSGKPTKIVKAFRQK